MDSPVVSNGNGTYLARNTNVSVRSPSPTDINPNSSGDAIAAQIAAQRLLVEQGDLRCVRHIEHLKDCISELERCRTVLQGRSTELDAISRLGSSRNSVRQADTFLLTRSPAATPEELSKPQECSLPKVTVLPIAVDEIVVRRAVGLRNRNTDCFWIAALQCLRHTPGFAKALTPAIQEADATLVGALGRVFYAMQESETSDAVRPDALENFRHTAMKDMPASDNGRSLVQEMGRYQKQQDTHEFLNQLLDCLAKKPLPGEQVVSPRSTGPSDEETLKRLETLEWELTLERDLTEMGRYWEKLDVQNLYNVLYEYSMIHWALSGTRMHSHTLSTLFEGQRIASTKCSQCNRFCASAAEPFTIEEVIVNNSRFASDWFGGQLGQIGSWLPGLRSMPSSIPLAELLNESSPAPEGYRCPNKRCLQVGSSTRTTQYLRLPSTLILHINRAQADGTRCEITVEFEATIDLGEMGLVKHFGKPLGRDLSPCSTRYHLIGAVFHRGPTARAGHYFAYVLDRQAWAKCSDQRVEWPTTKFEATPMSLEMNSSAGGPKVALMFYRRDDT